jgi:hypothetical protein
MKENVTRDSIHACSEKIQCERGYGVNENKRKCDKCRRNTFSKGGANPTCTKCKPHYLSHEGATECLHKFSNEWVIDKFRNIDNILAAQKEKTNDLSIKNLRLWQKEQIRLQHDKMMEKQKDKDNREEKNACQAERLDGTVIFPAIEIENEIEKIEDTTCIDTNRDELLKSFCSFTSDLDKLFKIQGIEKEAKTFWPNICCKERRDSRLEVCKDPSGKIKRENIIPFALSQGGDYSRHNLYSEVKESIESGGYIHAGMKKLLDSLPSIEGRLEGSKGKEAKGLVDAFFNAVSLCGPRIVDAPGNSERKLCELFVPYHHAMKNFYNLIKGLYTLQPLPIQTSFLETMEGLRKRSQAARVGKNNMQQVMQMKPKPAAQATCTGGSKWVSSKLKKKKKLFCKGYNHLDLSDTNIRNVAVHYLKQDITYNNTEMFRLSDQLRYQVTDVSCPSSLFKAKDISIQQVAMDALGKETEWVAVVNLNTQDDNGYLQSELPYCESKPYLIGAKIIVKAYVLVDDDNHCKGLVDYEKCKDNCVKECSFEKTTNLSWSCDTSCENKLTKLKDKHHKHYSKDVVLTGTQYRVDDSHVSRRRRLLRYRNGGC